MGVWDTIKSKVGLGEPEPPPPPPPPPPPLPIAFVQNATHALQEKLPVLTWQQRAIGFGITFGVGILLSFLSLTALWTFQLTTFAILYSFGSALSLTSTFFLMGPSKQFSNMTSGGRWAASLVYVGAIVATLVIAFTVKGIPGGVLVIVMIVLQFIAALWYCATYVPGGPELLAKCFGIKT